jgi:superfamily II DNA or RNA helicase
MRSGLLVGGLQKLVALKKRKAPLYGRVVSDSRIVLFDEAHKALAPTYRGLLEDFERASGKPVIVGITATPGRSAFDPIQNKQLAKLFNSSLIAPEFDGKDAIVALRDLGVLAKLNRRSIQSSIRVVLGAHEREFLAEFLDLPTSVLTRLSRNARRNELIVEAIVDQVRQDRQTIVFACSAEHSKLVAALLMLRGVKACTVTADLGPHSRLRCIEGFRSGEYDVIVNFGILSTGFDAPSTRAIVITRPTASVVLYSQMLGRGMRGRLVGGNEECTVVDIVDNIEGIYEYFAGYWN